MKARRKSDGKIIEVKTYMLNSRRGKDGSWESSYKDINSGLVYEASELLFNLDYYTVISGWVARNGSGPNDLGLHVYTVKPDRMKNRREWNGHGEMSYLIDSRLFPDITWESEPKEVELIIKRKKNG